MISAAINGIANSTSIAICVDGINIPLKVFDNTEAYVLIPVEIISASAGTVNIVATIK